nr:hypothetical protein [uncultured Rhodopila sp.]
MLTGTLLCSQSTKGLEPLGAFNQPVYKSYGQIRAALLNELGPLYADYFARPDTDAGGSSINWLAHQLGEPRRWVDLPAAEQTRLDPIRQQVSEGFARYRAQLEAAPISSPRNNFAKLLAQACCVPGQQYLYFVGDQPVVAFWGFKTMGVAEGLDPLRLVSGATVLRGAPVGTPPPIEPPPAAAAIIVPRRRRWWLWLLLLLLLLLLLALWAWWNSRDELTELINPIPPSMRIVPPGMAPPVIRPGGIVTHGPEGTPILRRDGGAGPPDGVVDRSGPGADYVVPPDHGVVSPAGPPVVPIGPGGRPIEGQGDAQRGDQPDGDTTGQNTAPPPTPDNPANGDQPMPPSGGDHPAIPPDLPALPPPGAPPAARGPSLAIPKTSTPGPAGFMQGVWRSRSGLMLNGKPAEEYYRFDKTGQGDVTLRTRDGSTQCSGAAQAAVSPDKHLNVKEAPLLTCSDGSSVAGAVTDCALLGGQSVCQGTNAGDGSHFGVQIEGVQKP